MWFGIHLVRRGTISADQRFAAVERQATQRTQIGELTVRRNKMTMKQVLQVHSRRADSHEPFGKIAHDLRTLAKRRLADLLFVQPEQVPSLQKTLVSVGFVSEETVAAEIHRARNKRLDRAQLPKPSTESQKQADAAAKLRLEPANAAEDTSRVVTWS